MDNHPFPLPPMFCSVRTLVMKIFLCGSPATVHAQTCGEYPVVSMTPPLAYAGSRDNLLGAAPSPARLEQFSLEKQARAGLPPLFIVHAKDDEKTPSEASRRLAAALHQAGVPAELVLYDKGGHGFALGRGVPSDEWKDSFTAWLSRTFN